METKGLMTGNWVIWEVTKKPVQITQISKNYVCANDGTSSWQRNESYSPIPLTKEFLDKNFEQKNGNYYISDDFFDFGLREYNDGTYIATYHCCEMCLPDAQIPSICYLHQLQNVLCIFGIDKEFVFEEEVTIDNIRIREYLDPNGKPRK